MPNRASIWAILITSIAVVTGEGADFYVSPSGNSRNSGSKTSPWDLTTALNHPVSVKPGDTIWLRGGTYVGLFRSVLTGTSESAHITVRQYPGERAILDGKALNGPAVLEVEGAYTWYWGFEITCTSNDRYSKVPGSDPPFSELVLAGGAEVGNNFTTPGIKFINMVVHDTRQAFGVWKGAIDGEVYGCLIYYNGWVSVDRGHGQGIYTQNESGNRLVGDNIAFSNCSHGVQAYGSETAPLNNITLDGNVLFLNADRDFVLGGGMVAQSPTVIANYCYKGGGASQLGYSQGLAHAVITQNFFMMPDSSTALRFRSVDASQVISFANNLIWGAVAWYWETPVAGFDQATYPNNIYTLARPTGVQTFVRPNKYDPARVNIVILNFDQKSAVSVNVAPSLLPGGSAYEIRDAQNYFGNPIQSGSYNGTSITIPMTGTGVVKPIGKLDHSFINAHTAAEFGVFVLIRK